MKRTWMTCLMLIALVSFTSPARAAERKTLPNPIGAVLIMVMMPVANTIDNSREAIGLEADTDYQSVETGEYVSANTVDIWRQQASQDEMNALGVKMSVVN